MTDARMAATNTHRRSRAVRSAVPRVDRMACSSHGLALGLIKTRRLRDSSCVVIRMRHRARYQVMDNYGSIASVADQNRNFRVRQHLGRRAAEHDCRNPAPAVRGHDDEIAASLLGGLDDRFVRMILFE